MQEFLTTLISNQSDAVEFGYGGFALLAGLVAIVSILTIIYDVICKKVPGFSIFLAAVSLITFILFSYVLVTFKNDASDLIESDLQKVTIIKDISDVSAVDAARAGMKVSKDDYDSVQSGTIDFLTETDVSPMSVYIVTRGNEVEIFEKVSSKSVTISKSEFEEMKE